MFEQLFGSKTRVKLMQIFLENPGKRFYVRELTRLTDSLINSVRRELENLTQLKFIVVEDLEREAEEKGEKVEKASKKKVVEDEAKTFNAKKYYTLNANNVFQRDLLNLFSKGKLLVEKQLVEKLKALGDLQYLAFGGIFVDDSTATTDVLIVGQFNRPKAKEVIEQFERETEKSVRYTLMDQMEYDLRQEVADNFLSDVLSNDRNMVIINNLKK
jgi:hypothetical protein